MTLRNTRSMSKGDLKPVLWGLAGIKKKPDMSDTITNPTRNPLDVLRSRLRRYELVCIMLAMLAVLYHELRTPATVIQKSIVQRASLQQ